MYFIEVFVIKTMIDGLPSGLSENILIFMFHREYCGGSNCVFAKTNFGY